MLPETSDDTRRFHPKKTATGIILGIDPGLERTGYAIIDAGGSVQRLLEAGLIRLNPAQALHCRLAELAEAMRHILETRRPDLVACEALYAHYKHPRTAILMAHARGVILAEAARAGAPVLDVSATQVKKSMTGNGRASKTQIQRAVAGALRLHELLEPHDVADAAAIALCGANLDRIRSCLVDSRAMGAAT
jgi:crossover junction endodeoxyribonuclease RuvC